MKNLLKDLGPNVVIIGTQWGDEGKGKLVDIISGEFDLIGKSTGGANAGHTVYVGDKKYIFHLFPSGLLHENTIGVIGNGVVISVPDFIQEIKTLEETGLSVRDRVKVSLQAHLVLDYHKQIDVELENRKGKDKVGTTGRGIGPAYTDKISRMGIRAEDLLDEELLKEKIERNCEFHAKNFGLDLDPKKELETLLEVKKDLVPLLCDTRLYLRDAFAEGKKVLFEGAQAYNLDIDHGTYPFVTSSSVSIGGVCTGLGVPPQKINGVVGIAKAYTTRVGSGPFPTELLDEMGEQIREAGGEYGSTTGRPRRCGWYDAVVVRVAVAVNGIDTINLTKLDVLSGVKEIKVASKYLLDGKEIEVIPSNPKDAQRIEVEYETFQGWDEDLTGINKFEDLPKNAQEYVLGLERLSNCSIRVIGTGKDRADIIFR